MAKDPAFLLMYKDLLVSCASWDADELGWYLRLLCHQADKPAGLPPALEDLALLAGVKMNQYDRFSQCWQRTLSANFQANAKGLLINPVLQESLSDRRDFKGSQAKRGLVGSYMKKAKADPSVPKENLPGLANELFKVLLPENSKEQNESAYKRTLLAKGLATAFIVNADANANGNINSKEEGVGETIDHFTPRGVAAEIVEYFKLLNPGYPYDQATDMPAGKQIADKILVWLSLKGRIEDNTREIVTWWRKLYDHAIGDNHLGKYSLSQLSKHFQPLVQSFNNAGSKTNRISTRIVKSGKSEGAYELLDQLRDDFEAPGS